MISPGLTRLLNGILLGGAALCCVVFLYVFYHYTLTGQREFGRPVEPFFFYGVPLVAAALLVASLRLRPDHRLSLILVLGSLSVALYFGEIGLGYISAKRAEAMQTIYPGRLTEERLEQIARMAARHGVDFDTRFGFDVVMDLREEGIQAVPIIPPAEFLREEPDGSRVSAIQIDGEEVVPLSGVARAVTVFCNESGEFVIYEADEYGFHNPEGTWDAHPVEVAALGDSFAHGMCVPSDRNFVARIREHHPNTLNLGFSGTGPLIQLAHLEEYLRPLEPRHVLWFYFEGNDHLDLVRESSNALLMRYLEGGFRQGVQERQESVDRALLDLVDEAIEAELARREEPRDPWWEPSRLVRAVTRPARLPHIRRSLGLLEPIREDLPREDLPLDLFRDVVEYMADAVESWSGSLYFVYLPTRTRYVTDRDFFYEEILGVVRETGVPIVDIHEAFLEHGDPLGLFPFRRWGHYTEEGNRLVAETVMQQTPLGGTAPGQEAGTASR